MKSENIEQNSEINRKEKEKRRKTPYNSLYGTTFKKVRIRLAKFAFHQEFVFLIVSTSLVRFVFSPSVRRDLVCRPTRPFIFLETIILAAKC